MKDILFRGQMKSENCSFKKGDWVFGDLVRLHDGKREIPCIYGKGDVVDKTVGQYIGIDDKNGQKIFEGDIVDVKYNVHYTGLASERIGLFEVVFVDGCFMKKNEKGCFHFISSDECEVVGNVHDNPEMMKGER